MPTKYTREGARDKRGGPLSPPYQRYVRKYQITPRQQLFLLFGGVLLVFICSFAAQFFFRGASLRSDLVHRAEGTLVAKEARPASGGTAYYLQIAVPVAFQGVCQGEIAVEKECWDRLQTGDRIAVLYRRAAARGDIRIVECGRFALDPGMQ